MAKDASLFSKMSTARARRRPRTTSSLQVIPGEAVYSLSKFTVSQQRIIQRGVNKALDDLHLKVSRVPKPQLGSRVLANAAVSNYLCGLRQLEYFLALIGDWSSMLILREDAPDFAPAIRDSSLCRFIDWKYASQGEVMTDADGNELKDAFGRRLKGNGCWKSPHNTTPFSAAVSNLHIARGFKHVGYSDVCDSCLDKYFNENDQNGCFHHAHDPHLWRKGNPRFSELYGNRIRRLVTVDLRSYQAQGDSPLTPRELINIRTYLMSQNCINAFRLWTMILVSVKQFRRGDEVICLDLEKHFLPELTTIRNGRVAHLALLVDGKRDVTPAILAAFVDDDVLELCLVRQLLAWIWISGYKGGPLFPHDMSADVPVPMSKQKFLEQFKQVCVKITGRKGPWGTHTGKKTGWLGGAWAGASDVSLAADSRHKDLAQAQRYKQDAMALLEIARAAGDDALLRMTPKYKHIFIRNLEMAESINIGGGHGDMSPMALAKEWVSCLVRNGSLARSRTKSKVDIAKAMLKNESAHGIDDQIDQIVEELKKNGFGSSIDKLISLIGRKFAVSERTVNMANNEFENDRRAESSQRQAAPPSASGLDNDESKQAEQEAHEKARATKQKQRERDLRRNGSFEVPMRTQISSVKGKQFMDAIIITSATGRRP